MKPESRMSPEVNGVFNLRDDVLSKSITVDLVAGIPLFDNVAELLDGFCVGIERGVRLGMDGMRVFPDDSSFHEDQLGTIFSNLGRDSDNVLVSSSTTPWPNLISSKPIGGSREVLIRMRTVITPNTKNTIIIKRRIFRRTPILKYVKQPGI